MRNEKDLTRFHRMRREILVVGYHYQPLKPSLLPQGVLAVQLHQYCHWIEDRSAACVPRGYDGNQWDVLSALIYHLMVQPEGSSDHDMPCHPLFSQLHVSLMVLVVARVESK
jgi:hypothetical protein